MGTNNPGENYMNTSMTGVGKLSRKLLTVAVIGVATSLAHAQSLNTSTTGPNNVYIEQIGNTNTITIQQVGASNNVGGIAGTTITTDGSGVTTWNPTAPTSINYATVNGSNNTVADTQTGQGNTAQYNIKGNNNTYNSTVTGDNNNTYLQIGDVGNPTNLRNVVNETITGSNNQSLQKLIGSDINSSLSVTGGYNQVTENLLSSKGSSTIGITGSNNILYSEQTDVAGANGHSLTQTVTGSYNSITTQQQGSIDTTVNIATTGDHNTVTVRTSSATIINPLTASAR